MENITLNAEDIDFDNNQNEDLAKNHRIEQLSKEISQLRAQMNVPPALRNAIGGLGIGQGLGVGAMGSVALGFLGYQLGKGKEIDAKQKQVLAGQIQAKARELIMLQRGEQVEDAKISGVMSADELRDFTYKSYAFDGKYKALIGQPAKSFHMMVFGRPKQGKSIFCFQLAKYLTKFGNVLYIAAEEGFSATLQQKLTEFGAVNERLYFANYRNFEQIRENLRNSDYEFVIIDSINFINLEPEDVETLKAENKSKAFITIQQATKNGAFRGSQQFAHNCDIIIEVVEGVANHTGRYAAPSEMQIFDKPNFKGSKKENKPAANQLEMFSESAGDF
jgi:RecA/RadA recombinase